jgi:sulfate permease, SulP family
MGVTVPVQPMKVIGAYAIATGMGAMEIHAAGLLIGLFLLLIGATGAVSVIGKYTPKPVVRGVQISTGTLLMVKGIQFILGNSTFQTLRGAAEPYLGIQSLGPLPIGIIIGILGAGVTLFFLENRRFPAGLLVVLGGVVTGLLLGTHEGLSQVRPGLYLPEFLPMGIPNGDQLSIAVLILVLPQIPMTLGNAVIAYADLSKEYFGNESRKVTYRSACVSMGFANLISFLFGGMPLCHGAGGLAAHYRFGARSAGSNLIIGGIFLVTAFLFGPQALAIAHLIPMAILGVLLVFAGSQLALTVIDLNHRNDLFVALTMLGITLAVNLAVAFGVGLVVTYGLKTKKLTV